MSTPQAQRKARKDYRDRQKAAGAKLSAFMLSREALEALDKIVGPKVSKNAAVNAALISAAKEQALREAGSVAVRERLVIGEEGAIKPDGRVAPSRVQPSAERPPETEEELIARMAAILDCAPAKIESAVKNLIARGLIVAPPTGSKKDGARTKKAEKPSKPSSEAPKPVAKASVGADLPVGPQPFTPRLKGLQKGKKA